MTVLSLPPSSFSSSSTSHHSSPPSHVLLATTYHQVSYFFFFFLKHHLEEAFITNIRFVFNCYRAVALIMQLIQWERCVCVCVCVSLSLYVAHLLPLRAMCVSPYSYVTHLLPQRLPKEALLSLHPSLPPILSPQPSPTHLHFAALYIHDSHICLCRALSPLSFLPTPLSILTRPKMYINIFPSAPKNEILSQKDTDLSFSCSSFKIHAYWCLLLWSIGLVSFPLTYIHTYIHTFMHSYMHSSIHLRLTVWSSTHIHMDVTLQTHRSEKKKISYISLLWCLTHTHSSLLLLSSFWAAAQTDRRGHLSVCLCDLYTHPYPQITTSPSTCLSLL